MYNNHSCTHHPVWNEDHYFYFFLIVNFLFYFFPLSFIPRILSSPSTHPFPLPSPWPCCWRCPRVLFLFCSDPPPRTPRTLLLLSKSPLYPPCFPPHRSVFNFLSPPYGFIPYVCIPKQYIFELCINGIVF